LEAGVVFLSFDANSAETGEPEDVEHIFGAGGSADDVLADGFRRVGLLEFGNGAEGVEDLGGLFGQSRRKR
jgi:hypothetical protein